MKKIYLLLVCLLSVSCCFSQTNYCIQGRFSQDVYFDTTEITIKQDVMYGNAVNNYTTQPQDLKMDVYYPKPEIDLLAKKPLIFFIHGGGFLEGDKADEATKCTQWAQRGYVAVSINYRMGWNCANSAAALLCSCTDGQGVKIAMYEAVQDARAGLRYMSAHADEYGADTTSFFVGGESAGSITAMHSSYWTQQSADSVSTVFYQQLGALDSSGNQLHAGYKLKGIIDNCGAVNDTSIINTDNALPTISFHDENDCAVPFKLGFFLNCTGSCDYLPSVMGSYLVSERLSDLNACSKLYEVPNSNNHCSFPQDQLMQKAACFVKNILCGDCSPGFSINAYDTMDCNAGIVATGIAEPVSTIPHLVYPNPTENNTTLVFMLSESGQVTLTLVDVLGRQMEYTSAVYDAGRQEIKITGDQLTAGINFYVLRTKNGMVSGKVVKQ